MPPNTLGRHTFTTLDTITCIWSSLSLPSHALSSLSLPECDKLGLPSSYKIGHLAQSSIALSALAAALVHSVRTKDQNQLSAITFDHFKDTTRRAPPPVPKTTIPLQQACIEFSSERHYSISSKRPPIPSFAIGGLHPTANGGYIRIHDGFPHHRANALKLLGCSDDSTREEIDAALSKWDAVELENKAIGSGAVMGALRSVEEWGLLEQAGALANLPVVVRRVADGHKGWKKRLVGGGTRSKALQGIRVLELSRVIAAPVAGRTLAAHGADVLWVTSPNLPDLPMLDIDTSRGKRRLYLDLDESKDRKTLDGLCEDVDVVLQGYRPGALANKGLDVEELVNKSKNGIVYASLSAYGSTGPWNERRGFDSIVQTQSGLNVSEAERFGAGEASKVLPCQALDHASGYFLAFGIMAALYKQATEGGSYTVEVSLAATMKYLTSLGQYEGNSGFDCADYRSQQDLPPDVLETKKSVDGPFTAVKHSASIDGVSVGWDMMPQQSLGTAVAKWS